MLSDLSRHSYVPQHLVASPLHPLSPIRLPANTPSSLTLPYPSDCACLLRNLGPLPKECALPLHTTNTNTKKNTPKKPRAKQITNNTHAQRDAVVPSWCIHQKSCRFFDYLRARPFFFLPACFVQASHPADTRIPFTTLPLSTTSKENTICVTRFYISK